MIQPILPDRHITVMLTPTGELQAVPVGTMPIHQKICKWDKHGSPGHLYCDISSLNLIILDEQLTNLQNRGNLFAFLMSQVLSSAVNAELTAIVLPLVETMLAGAKVSYYHEIRHPHLRRAVGPDCESIK